MARERESLTTHDAWKARCDESSANGDERVAIYLKRTTTRDASAARKAESVASDRAAPTTCDARPAMWKTAASASLHLSLHAVTDPPDALHAWTMLARERSATVEHPSMTVAMPTMTVHVRPRAAK